jgi:predicted methyltransferase
MRRRISSLALCAALLAQPLFTAAVQAKPADYAPLLSDPLRTPQMHKQDEGRMPVQVLDFAKVKKGQKVLDFFAGGGYYSLLLARAVGEKGSVIAANPPGENDPKAWDAFAAKVPQLQVKVMEVADMKFAPKSFDLLFTNLNYHDLYWESEKYHFPRIEVPPVLAGWFAQVKPGGHVVIIDHAGPAGDTREIADRLHRIDEDRVKADMKAAGFVLEAEGNFLQNKADDHSKLVFDPSVRGKTDRFILRFRRP